MRKNLCLLLGSYILAVSPAYGEVYKTVQPDGTITYSDRPQSGSQNLKVYPGKSSTTAPAKRAPSAAPTGTMEDSGIQSQQSVPNVNTTTDPQRVTPRARASTAAPGGGSTSGGSTSGGSTSGGSTSGGSTSGGSTSGGSTSGGSTSGGKGGATSAGAKVGNTTSGNTLDSPTSDSTDNTITVSRPVPQLSLECK
ncbi:DUF4124 domain-containing protein [Methylobacillus flagellatus]|nr:DUF4124 domain-containing protein [Methylobacillus flagellatus]